jgi:hypothetical protein
MPTISRAVILTTWIALLTVSHARAQTSPTPAFSQVPDPNAAIVKLLQSSDPKQQAWGAWYAGRDHLVRLAPLLHQVVVRNVVGSSLNESAATDIALDALIQMRQALPSLMLASVHDRRPAQALILAGFADKEDADVDSFLFDVLRAQKYDEWFAAANVLLERRTPRLASAIIRNLRLTLDVYVTDGGHGAWVGGSGSGMSIGCGASGAAPGLPPWAAYRLGTATAPGMVVASAGPTPVYYQRVLAPAGSTPAGSVVYRAGPSADERLQYLARLAQIVPTDLPVRGVEIRSVNLSDAVQPDGALRSLKAEVLRKWQTLADLLVRASALPAEGRTIELPSIDIVVHDSRGVRAVTRD